jgi:AcrR family transcriptional regulator
MKTTKATGDKRTGTHERALSAATEIIRRDGYARLTMERVAAQSGVAKTTLYRRWPTRAALCMDVYLDVAGRELHDPDTGEIESDLRYIVNTVVHLQTRTVAGPALIGLLVEAQSNPEAAAESLVEFSEQRRKVTRVVLRRAIERGELRPDTDVDLVIDALGGATTFRLLQRHAPLSRKFAEAIVTLVLSGCRSAAAPKSRKRKR